jgi:hypothetical protein
LGTDPERVAKRAPFGESPRETCALCHRQGVERTRAPSSRRAPVFFVIAMRLFPSLVESKMAEMNGTA